MAECGPWWPDEERVRPALVAIRSSAVGVAGLEEARAYARSAQEALLALPGTRPRHILAALAEHIAGRRH
jgi:hypothetical protein